MIAIFDEDGGGTVDFQEFVSGLSAFSSKGNKEQKLKFAFKVYDIDRDGFISNGELFIVLKMMVGNNLKDQQLQQIVDKTIMEADLDQDGKISFEEFTKMVENTDVSISMTLGGYPCFFSSLFFKTFCLGLGPSLMPLLLTTRCRPLLADRLRGDFGTQPLLRQLQDKSTAGGYTYTTDHSRTSGNSYGQGYVRHRIASNYILGLFCTE